MAKRKGKQTVDRDTLVSALERMADRIYWECLKTHTTKREYHVALARASGELACKSREAKRMAMRKGRQAKANKKALLDIAKQAKEEQAKEEEMLGIADQHDSLAETYRMTANEMWQAYNIADAGLRELTPELYGGLPVVDRETVKTVSPATMAQQIRELLGKVLAKLSRQGGQQNGQSKKHVPENPQWDKATEARNKWLYEQCLNGVVFATIIKQLGKKRKTWGRIESPNGIKKQANAYAIRNGLPLIPKRQSGTSKRKKTDK